MKMSLVHHKRWCLIGALLILPPYLSYAAGVGSSGGATLIASPSARASALGEAFSASSNDIAGFSYNPASLNSLLSGHASFLYHQVLEDESFGQFMIGFPLPKGSLGFSVGYYDGGELDLFDGVTRRTVAAQQDIVISLGYAQKVGTASIGLTGKYLSSELGEVAKATAFAGDLGLQFPVHPRIRFGAAVQNMGTELKFVENGDPLPLIARAGLNILIVPGPLTTSLLLEAPYFLNEEEFQPSVGLEIGMGLLAIRTGYKWGREAESFSIGSGFLLGQISLDYAFGLVNSFETQHRVSLSTRFRGEWTKPHFVETPDPQPRQSNLEINEETFTTVISPQEPNSTDKADPEDVAEEEKK